MNGNRDTANPWLNIPAADYETHMAHAEVGQLQFLNRVFRDVLVEFRPAAVAVVGCTTGNGFEHIRNDITTRVVGIDINPSYLEIVRRRFAGRIAGLELICTDIRTCELPADTFDLVHAALVLEYVRPAIVIDRAADWLRRGGLFVAVLQLPSPRSGKVTDTGITSLEPLERFMNLVGPADLNRIAVQRGFLEVRTRRVGLPGAKEFHVAIFRLEA